MFCCCSKKSSIPASIAGASVILGGAAVSSGVLHDEPAPTTNTPAQVIVLSEAVYGVWDGVATGEGLPPDGEPFILDLAPGNGGGITGTLETTNFGGFDVADAVFNDEDGIFSCTIVNQMDPNMAAGFVAVVDGDVMAGAVSAPDVEYSLTAERRQN
ncbi:MAG: hypothetical protein ACF8QF_11600 [Phycisphaerales bacterium]